MPLFSFQKRDVARMRFALFSSVRGSKFKKKCLCTALHESEQPHLMPSSAFDRGGEETPLNRGRKLLNVCGTSYFGNVGGGS